MRSVTVRLEDLRTMILNLGFVGENEHRKFNFDCKKMFGEYPSASVSLTVQPPAGDCYPATVERNGDLVSWTVTDSDLIEEGCGEIQLTFMVGEVVAKTCIGRTKVERSLGATGDIPTPIENWIEQAEEVISEAEAATAAAEAAAEHQPIIDDNGYWAVWDADAEEYVATEYKAQGTDGQDGVGIVSIEKTGTSGLVDTYTITFTSGNPVTYTVTNGRDADPAELIDDTSTATNKTWSAKKISDENSSLLTEINSKADKTVTDALQKNKAPVIIDHAEGNPIVLTDGADGLPVESMKIHFLPKQDTSGGDPSPSHVCPISGWTGVTAWRTGKNLLDDSKKVKSGSNIYVGTETANTPCITLPPGTYTVSFVITENLQRNLYAKDADTGENIPGFPSYQAYSTSPAVVTFTLTKQTRIILWTYNTSYTSASDVISVMLNVGSTASPYAEYTGESYHVTFPALGKNLIDLNESNLESGSIAGATGNNEAATNRVRTKVMRPFPFDSIYDNGYVLTIPTGYKIAMRFYKEDGTYVAMSTGQVGFITSLPSSVYGQGAEYVRWIFAKTDDSAISASDIAQTTYQLERGTTASAYEPFTNTVYGGTLDAVNGVLKVEWGLFTVTSEKLNALTTGWNDVYGAWVRNLNYNEGITREFFNGTDTVPCSFASCVVNNKGITASQYRTSFLASGWTSYEDFYNAVLSLEQLGTPLTYAAPIATPIEIPLDPITIQTLLGYNTIWSDANGTIELDYRADTKLFIAKNKQDIRATIAPIEDGTTASKAYSAGKLFYHDGNLCKAKTSIASGATFTLNTNYQITTVADELFALN